MDLSKNTFAIEVHEDLIIDLLGLPKGTVVLGLSWDHNSRFLQGTLYSEDRNLPIKEAATGGCHEVLNRRVERWKDEAGDEMVKVYWH